ncbi:MAG: response regulator [Deltaproteobacteria bacterium]|nr:response regulator [Deltaproteobacteria bacterium]
MAEVESQRIGLFRADKTTPISLEELPLTRAMRGESIDGAEIFVRPETAPDGVWLNANARPLRGEGLEGGGVAVFRDVTAAKSAQAQLMVADRMVSVGTLAAGVAHEINNPLAVLIANLGFAAKAIADAGTDALGLREALSDAQEAAERIRMVVRDLKLFSRADEDKRGPVDVQLVMESTLRMTWNEIRFRARLVKDYGVVPMVDANESRLGQVFMNLVVNAAQAIPEGNANKNEIRITTKLDPSGKVVVEIRDTGTGIPPDVVSRIFEPFFTTKPVGVGTGLGLSICRNLITAMGGEIQVESRVSVGTVFRIVLPASAGEGDVPFAKTIIPTGRRGRILVVDDEPALGKALHRVISQDHDVEVMTSAKEALARVVAGERYDIILCDVMMPEMNGMDLYEALARVDAASAQRMIFITGGAFTQRAREFLSRVPNQRLDKPFDEQGLRHTLRALIT